MNDEAEAVLVVDQKDIVIVIPTSIDLPELCQKAIQNGAHHYISKGEDTLGKKY